MVFQQFLHSIPNSRWRKHHRGCFRPSRLQRYHRHIPHCSIDHQSRQQLIEDARQGDRGNAGQLQAFQNCVGDEHVAQCQGALVKGSKGGRGVDLSPAKVQLLQGWIGGQGSKDESEITVIPVGADKRERQMLQIQVSGLNRLNKDVQVDP